MPGIFRTYGENVAELSQPVRESPSSGGAQQENITALPVTQPSTPGSTPTTASPAAGGSSPLTPAASSSPAQAPAQAPAQGPASPYLTPLAESGPAQAPKAPQAPQTPALGNYAQLFKPVLGNLGSQYGKLSNAVNQFNQGAGASRSYDSAGTQGALQQAADRGSAEDLTAARGFLGSKYTGPTQLDPAAIAELQNAASSYRATLPNLGSVENVVSLLGQSAPNLTRGEKYFEARNLWNDPQFRATAQSLGSIGGSFSSDVQSAQNQAQAYATARGGEESDIATKSQAFLQSLKDQEKTDLASRATGKETGRQSILDQFKAFTQSGDVSKLAGIQGAPTAADFQQFSTPADAQKAQAARTAIDAKYQDLKDVPELSYRETRRGSIIAQLDPDWLSKNKSKYSSQQLKDLTARATARNREYQDAGLVGKQIYAPHLYEHGAVAGHPGPLTPEEAQFIYGIQPGSLEAYSGLELGGSDQFYGSGLGAYQAPDARSLINFSPGNNIPYSAENVASDAERERYNRIAALIGSPDQLFAGTAPSELSAEFHPERYDAAAENQRRQDALRASAIQFAQNEYNRKRDAGHSWWGKGGDGGTSPPPK